MTKTKHPSNRAERLKLKKTKLHVKKKEPSDKVRKLIKEDIKIQETEDELREVTGR